MSAGEIDARFYSTAEPVHFRWQHGVIVEAGPSNAAVDPDLWLVPALVDLQVNGFAGVDFQQDDLTADDLLQATRALRQAGCGRFLLTLMTDRWEVMLKRLKRLRALRAQSPFLQQSLAGWHIEGPFLSSVPGYCGAHNPDCMQDPTSRHIQELRSAAGSDPVLLTVAPERNGALEAIEVARSLAIRVSLGHTNASAATLAAAVQAGASGFTHFANACPQTLDRHDNILWRVLETPGLTLSLIPDGHHVSPSLFRIVHRHLGAQAVYYTTDAVSAAGAPPGRYRVGHHSVEVGSDRVVRHPGQTNFAGSGLQPIDGVVRAASMLGVPWAQVWDGFSVRPARFMGWRGDLAVGETADFCLVRATERCLTIERTFVNGNEES